MGGITQVFIEIFLAISHLEIEHWVHKLVLIFLICHLKQKLFIALGTHGLCFAVSSFSLSGGLHTFSAGVEYFTLGVLILA